MVTDETPFLDLPAALVEEVIGQATAAGGVLLRSLSELRIDRDAHRKALMEKGLIIHESTLGYPPIPTTCGCDGSYAIERLLTADLAAAAAVAVEGLTPPSEVRHWDQPHHSAFVVPEVHHPDTATVLRAVMLGRELLLAAGAPHDLVMIDGTLTTPIIHFNQALNPAPDARTLLSSKEFVEHCMEYLCAYKTILQSQRSDKHYIGLPKYSSSREIGHAAGWSGPQDDRAFLTLLLNPGELTRPLGLEQLPYPWHIDTGGQSSDMRIRIHRITDGIVEGLNRLNIFYYRPHEWLPALRVEASPAITENSHRLACVLQGLKHQCATPSILEPYPLYLADRMVKALRRALPAFRQVATQHISESYKGDIGEVFFAMHGYRTEGGR